MFPMNFLCRYQGSQSGWEIKWPPCKAFPLGQLLSSYASLLLPSLNAPVTWLQRRSSYLCWPQWWVVRIENGVDFWTGHQRQQNPDTGQIPDCRRQLCLSGWLSEMKCHRVYFIPNGSPQSACSIEPTPCGSRPIFPYMVAHLVGHSAWMSGPPPWAPPPLNNLPNAPILNSVS